MARDEDGNHGDDHDGDLNHVPPRGRTLNGLTHLSIVGYQPDDEQDVDDDEGQERDDDRQRDVHREQICLIGLVLPQPRGENGTRTIHVWINHVLEELGDVE